jgi:hypothetical protein
MHCDKEDDDNNNNTWAVESDFYYWNGPDLSPDLQPIFLRFLIVKFPSVLVAESCCFHWGFCTTVYVFFSLSCKVRVRSIAAAFSLSCNVNFAWLVLQFRPTEVHVSHLVIVSLSWHSVQANAERVHHNGSLSLSSILYPVPYSLLILTFVIMFKVMVLRIPQNARNSSRR